MRKKPHENVSKFIDNPVGFAVIVAQLEHLKRNFYDTTNDGAVRISKFAAPSLYIIHEGGN